MGFRTIDPVFPRRPNKKYRSLSAYLNCNADCFLHSIHLCKFEVYSGTALTHRIRNTLNDIFLDIFWDLLYIFQHIILVCACVNKTR